MAFNGVNLGAFQSAVKKLLRSNCTAGVEVVFTDNEKYLLNSTILRSTKSDLEIVNTKTSINQVDDLDIEPMVPVNIVLNGKGIIHKLVEAEADVSDNTLLQQVLPNAKLENFYLDKKPATDGRHMVSVLRKDLVDPVLESFSKHGLYVVSASFGPFVLHSVKSLLDVTPDGNWSVHFAGHSLDYESDKIKKYCLESGSGTLVDIGGEQISEESVIPFAAAFESHL